MNKLDLYPLEKVLLVRPQASAAIGYVIAVTPRNQKRSVAVMARSKDGLKDAVAVLTDEPIDFRFVRRVAMIQEADVTLDDEL